MYTKRYLNLHRRLKYVQSIYKEYIPSRFVSKEYQDQNEGFSSEYVEEV